MSEKNQEHEREKCKEPENTPVVQMSTSVENVLQLELKTLEEWCQSLIAQNEELVFAMEELKNKSEKVLAKERREFKEEMQVLQRVIKSSFFYTSDEMQEKQNKYERDIETLHQENSRLKSENKERIKRPSLVESIFSARFKRKPYSYKEDGDDTEMLLESLHSAEVEATTLKSHLKPLEVQIKVLKKKIHFYLSQLSSYRSCFDWMSNGKEDNRNVTNKETATQLDPTIMHRASEIKHMFIGLEHEEIVKRCSEDQMLCSDYLSMLHTQIDVQKHVNENIMDELSAIHFKISCQSVHGTTRHSIDSTFSRPVVKLFQPCALNAKHKIAMPLSTLLPIAEEEDVCSDTECTYCNNEAAISMKRSSGSMLNLMVEDENGDTEKIFDENTLQLADEDNEDSSSHYWSYYHCQDWLQKPENERTLSVGNTARSSQQLENLSFQTKPEISDRLKYIANECGKLSKMPEYMVSTKNVVMALAENFSTKTDEIEEKLDEVLNEQQEITYELKKIRQDNFDLLGKYASKSEDVQVATKQFSFNSKESENVCHMAEKPTAQEVGKTMKDDSEDREYQIDTEDQEHQTEAENHERRTNTEAKHSYEDQHEKDL